MAVTMPLPCALCKISSISFSVRAYLNEDFVGRALAVDLGQELGELDRRHGAGDADK